MQKDKRETCLLLDRPLHHAGNHPPAPAKRTFADRNRGADEFLFRVLLQPVCAEANQLVAFGIQERVLTISTQFTALLSLFPSQLFCLTYMELGHFFVACQLEQFGEVFVCGDVLRLELGGFQEI